MVDRALLQLNANRASALVGNQTREMDSSDSDDAPLTTVRSSKSVKSDMQEVGSGLKSPIVADAARNQVQGGNEPD